MITEIVLAFTPSNDLKDWFCGFDADHKQWYYEHCTRFYHESHGFCCGGFISCPPRNVGHEPYYDLEAKKIVKRPRIYLTHHPKKGEWEHLKTVDDLKESVLFVGIES